MGYRRAFLFGTLGMVVAFMGPYLSLSAGHGSAPSPPSAKGRIKIAQGAHPHVPYLSPTSMVASGGDLPTSGTWEIVSPFTGNWSFAINNSDPEGWTVTYQAGTLTVTAPDQARAVAGCEVRYNDNGMGRSAYFDVVPRVPSGSMLEWTLSSQGQAPDGTHDWEVL